MIERRADEFRLEPTLEDLGRLQKFVGCRRWVWNRALALQLERLEQHQTLLTYVELAKHLTAWRHDPATEWLSEGPVHTQQSTLRDLDRAFQRWRKGTSRRPRFKKKGRHESIRYPDCKQIKFDCATRDPEGRTILPRIFLPKIGWVKFRMSRPLSGKVCNATVSCKGGLWYVSIQTEMDISPEPIPQTEENTIGGDVGLCCFLKLSDGRSIEKPQHIQRIEERLCTAQRKLSRMKRGSKNHTAQKKRVQRIHRQAACARKDFLHKVSSDLSKNHAYVKLENAQVQRMVKSPDTDLPGESQTHAERARFNRRLLDVGWGMFLFLLDYKLRARGGGLILVNPAYTSQECSCCGSIHKENRPTRDRFYCLACHHEEDADWNAAKVIKQREGPSRLACERPPQG